MAVAVLRSPDGRVRAIWRFLIAAVFFIACEFTVARLLRPAVIISAASIAALAIIVVLLTGGFAVLSRTLDRATNPLAYMGFPRDVPVARSIVVGFLFGAALISLAVLVLALGGSTTFRWRMNAGMLQAAAMQFVLFAVAALHEEVAFRGYPFQRLTEATGPVWAVVVLAALFAVPHIGNPNSSLFSAFNTAGAGALLAAAYLCTRSLWFVWGIHWGWNFVLAVVYGLSVSGFDTDGPVDGMVAGPQWLTGGTYGVEGGASGTIAIAVGFAVLLWLRWRPALLGGPALPPSMYVAVPAPAISDGFDPPSSSGPLSSSGPPPS
jgi:membrane protease YdiL (CAAX protease family)